jgi:hypothetical protein
MVMAVLVVTAAPMPAVVMAASAVHVTVAMAMAAPMPDLDHGAVICGDRGHAQSGRSGGGHGQRCNQGGSNQDDASHQVFSRARDCDVMHKLAGERLFRCG